MDLALMYIILIVIWCNSKIIDIEASNATLSPDTKEPLLKTTIVTDCAATERSVLIKGENVKFSEFLSPNGTVNAACDYNSNLTVVYVFATSRVIIDEDFEEPVTEMFVVAPTWEIVERRMIRLDGADGEAMSKPAVRGKGADGMSGSPGNPGKPGGNFVGIGEHFIDGELLTISSNGGNGGPGQDGGDGGPGDVGRHADKDKLDLTCSHSSCDSEGTKKIIAVDNLGNYSEFRCWQEYNNLNYDTFFLPPTIGNTRQCSYYVFGQEGTVSGSGGDGGVGSKGGLPGNIILVEMNQSSGISKVSLSGLRGENGKGGIITQPGYFGLTVSFKKNESYSHNEPYILGSISRTYFNSSTMLRSGIEEGIDGGNSFHIKDPVPAKTLQFDKLISVLQNYTEFEKNPAKP